MRQQGSSFHFDESWREEARLDDGSRVLLRLILPTDKEALQRGFGQLSERSRFWRFLWRKPRLTDRELQQLTELDGSDHFAIIAMAVPEGEAQARALADRSQSGPTAAGPAVQSSKTAGPTAEGSAAEGLGVARFARLADQPEVAEPAVTVVDHAQGKGLGSLLLTRLAAAARERGIERFACEFLAVNEPIRYLIEKLSRDACFEERFRKQMK